MTPGKGHSVHGSYEADGPSEGLVVKLTTTSGKDPMDRWGQLRAGHGFWLRFRGCIGHVKVVERVL